MFEPPQLDQFRRGHVNQEQLQHGKASKPKKVLNKKKKKKKKVRDEGVKIQNQPDLLDTNTMMAFAGTSDLAKMDLNQGSEPNLMDEEPQRRSPPSAKKSILAKYGNDEQRQQPQSIQFSGGNNWMEGHQGMPAGSGQITMNGYPVSPPMQSINDNQGNDNPFRQTGVAANPYAVNANVANYNAMRNRQIILERNGMTQYQNQNQRRQSGNLPDDVLGSVNPFR